MKVGLKVVLSKQFGTGAGLSDDELFHLTCHIDRALQEKNERGDYVDLKKLLPCNNIVPGQNVSGDGHRLE